MQTDKVPHRDVDGKIIGAIGVSGGAGEQDGQVANLNLPSRVMANPAAQSLTPTVRDAAKATSSDAARPAPPIEVPAALPVPAVIVGTVARPKSNRIPGKVWALLAILGMAIGLGVAIAVVKLM